MKIATFNVNGVNGRLPVLLRWLARSAARRRLPAGAEGAAGDSFPTPRSARPATARSGTARRAGTASPSWRAARSRSRRGAACRATPTTCTAATSRRRVGGVLVGCLYLPNGNPAPGPEVRLQAALVRAPDGARRRTARDRRAGRAGRRLQRHADRARRLQAGALGRRRPVPAGGARGLSRGSSRRAGPMRCGTLHPGERIYTFWDYFRNAGRAMPGCGSIICC